MVQHLDIGYPDPAHRLAFGRFFRGVEMEIDPISCDYGKTLVLIRGGKAELPIKGQSLPQIPNGEAGSD